MARTMSSAMLAAIQATSLRPAIFLMATFATGPVYLWTGLGNITWNSQTWTGIGTFGGISSIEEGSNIQARGITITTSAFDPAWLSAVLTEFQLGASVIVYLGLFDSTPALLADPVVSWAGRMDQPVIDVAGTTATISISCENRLIDLNTPSARRYTNDDQQLDFPGDQGFQWVCALQEVTLYWGASPLSPNNI